jgi:hypothetical protein
MRLWDSKTSDCLLTVRPGLSSLTSSIVDIPIHTMRYIPGSVDQLVVCTNSSKVFLMNTSGQTLQTLHSGKKSGGDFVAATISSQGEKFFSHFYYYTFKSMTFCVSKGNGCIAPERIELYMFST